jgi:signal transduction histidine kinase
MTADTAARDDRRQHRQSGVATGTTSTPGSNAYRRQITHDIQHELSTIAMLARAVSTAEDVGTASRARVMQILEETRWLSGLVHIYEDEASLEPGGAGPAVTRLDLLAMDILRPIRMSSRAQIVLEASAVSARIDRLAFWRALRNVVWNALAAAGEAGHLVVRISSAQGTAVVEVEDDGPGFDPAGATHSSLGLTIVEAFVVTCGGRVSIHRGTLGGCVVRLKLPEAS